MIDEAEVLAFAMFLLLILFKLVGLVTSWVVVFLPYLIKLFLVILFILVAMFGRHDDDYLR